jgi:glucokinase
VSIDAPDGLPGDGERPVLAVVIETGRLAAGLVDGAGGVIVRDRIAIPAHDVWPGLERLIGRVLAAAPRTVEPPQAVGVLCSGTVDTRAGAVSPHYVPAWSVFPLRQRLEDLTERPVVLDTLGGGLALARLRAIDDRARAAETASDVDEWPEHVIRSRSFLELRVGATVDSGCVISGGRLRGAHGNAGSVAHTNVDPYGRTCWCGSTGCLEVTTSASAIEAEIGRPLQHANASIVERTGMMLGRAVASFAATVDVSTVFVSGSVLEVMGPAVMSSMRRELAARARLPNLVDLTVVEAPPPVSPIVAAALAVEHGERDADPVDAATGG